MAEKKGTYLESLKKLLGMEVDEELWLNSKRDDQANNATVSEDTQSSDKEETSDKETDTKEEKTEEKEEESDKDEAKTDKEDVEEAEKPKPLFPVKKVKISPKKDAENVTRADVEANKTETSEEGEQKSKLATRFQKKIRENSEESHASVEERKKSKVVNKSTA